MLECTRCESGMMIQPPHITHYLVTASQTTKTPFLPLQLKVTEKVINFNFWCNFL